MTTKRVEIVVVADSNIWDEEIVGYKPVTYNQVARFTKPAEASEEEFDQAVRQAATGPLVAYAQGNGVIVDHEGGWKAIRHVDILSISSSVTDSLDVTD